MQFFAKGVDRSRLLPVILVLALGGAGCKQEEKLTTFDLRGEPIAALPSGQDSTNQGTANNLTSRTNSPSDVTALAAPNPAIKTTNSQQFVLNKDGFLSVGFDTLAGYAIEIPDEMLSAPLATVTNQPSPTDLIPKPVLALDKRPVSLQGFMLPLKVENGLVTELLLMKDQSQCCYGTIPKINEWVSVRMSEGGVRPLMDVPITMQGKLHVGAMVENGYLVGIYSMDGQKMIGPPD